VRNPGNFFLVSQRLKGMASKVAAKGIIENNTLIDTDVHTNWVWDREDLMPYVEEPHLSRLKVTKYPLSKSDGYDRTMGGKIELPRVEKPEDFNIALCEEFGVDYPIVNPGSSLPGVPEPRLAVALMSAYNDWMIDNFLDEYDHFYGLEALAPQDPVKAAEELDRVGGEDQIVGAYLRTSGPNLPWGDPEYDVVYEAAEDNNLDIAFHGGAGDFLNDFSKQYQTLDTFLEQHSLAHPWSQMLPLTSIIFNGVPEKFPSLNYVFLEAGVGWAPFMAGRLNEEYSKRRSEAPLLKKLPEEYIRESCYFAQQPIPDFMDSASLKHMFDAIGPDNIVFATDYPHWEFDHPSGLEEILRTHYEQEDWEKILGGNASDAFGLDIVN
jgi:predicted TIM-barrel fold metal-dependent hydrolase